MVELIHMLAFRGQWCHMHTHQEEQPAIFSVKGSTPVIGSLERLYKSVAVATKLLILKDIVDKGSEDR